MAPLCKAGFINESECKPGIAIHPDISINSIEKLLPKVKLAIIMTVVPGFGGQKFLDSQVEKISHLNSIRKDMHFDSHKIKPESKYSSSKLFDCTRLFGFIFI